MLLDMLIDLWPIEGRFGAILWPVLFILMMVVFRSFLVSALIGPTS